jgi:hypothetical protein
MRRAILAVAASVACATSAQGQAKTTTDCVSYLAGTLTCTTKEDTWSAWARRLRAANERAAQSAREDARVAALLSQQQAEDKALATVFVPKALYVINGAVDTLALTDAVERAFRREASDVVSNLFVARPTAPTAEIADAILPLVASYQKRLTAFNARASGALQVAADSLGLPGSSYDHFLDLAVPALLHLRGRNLTASDEEMQLSLDPAVRETKALIDSLGTVKRQQHPARKRTSNKPLPIKPY